MTHPRTPTQARVAARIHQVQAEALRIAANAVHSRATAALDDLRYGTERYTGALDAIGWLYEIANEADVLAEEKAAAPTEQPTFQPDDLTLALAQAFTPDALDALATVIGRRVRTDVYGVYRRLEQALRAAERISLDHVTEPEPVTSPKAGVFDRLALIEHWTENLGLNPASGVEAALPTQEADQVAGLVDAVRADERTTHAVAFYAEADRVESLGGAYNRIMAVGVRAAARTLDADAEPRRDRSARPHGDGTPAEPERVTDGD